MPALHDVFVFASGFAVCVVMVLAVALWPERDDFAPDDDWPSEGNPGDHP